MGAFCFCVFYSRCSLEPLQYLLFFCWIRGASPTFKHVHMLYLQVTFEDHKENLSRMFRQYQRQESAGLVRTISGISQRMETMESVNGALPEESAPSTMIELTVDSPSSPTSTSSPTEPSEDAEPASITVSNVLEQGGENEPQEEQSREAADECVAQVCDGEGTGGGSQVEMADHSTTEGPVTGERDPSDAEGESTNEANMEASVVSEQKVRSEMSPTAAPCLENSAPGGASVFNEDSVDVSSVSDQVQPSDADDSQEESSSITSPAGEEAEVVKEEEIQHGCEDMKDKEQEVGTEEKAEETNSPPGETPEKGVTESPKADQSSAVTPTTTADQASESTTPPTVQEGAASSASTSEKQPSEAAKEAATSEHADSSTAASSSGKTKEIKIARLDVSNVASDTERLELKQRVCIVQIGFFPENSFQWN